MEKYIVWKHYGVEGWSPEEFNTLKECVDFVMKTNYGMDYKITKEVKYEIKQVEQTNP